MLDLIDAAGRNLLSRKEETYSHGAPPLADSVREQIRCGNGSGEISKVASNTMHEQGCGLAQFGVLDNRTVETVERDPIGSGGASSEFLPVTKVLF